MGVCRDPPPPLSLTHILLYVLACPRPLESFRGLRYKYPKLVSEEEHLRGPGGRTPKHPLPLNTLLLYLICFGDIVKSILQVSGFGENIGPPVQSLHVSPVVSHPHVHIDSGAVGSSGAVVHFIQTFVHFLSVA